MGERAIAAYRKAYRRLTAPDGPFALFDVHVNGRSVKAYRSAQKNIADILLAARQRYATETFVVEPHRISTYESILDASRSLAAVLAEKHGVRPGDRVGIAMHNRVEWFVAFVAVARLGAVAVLFNSRSVGSELTAALDLVPCVAVLADNERAQLLSDVAIPVLDLKAIAHASSSAQAEPAPCRVDSDAPAVILFTSGTTGSSRAVVLTQRNLTNMERNIAFIEAMTLEIEAELRGIEVTELRRLAPRQSGLLVFPLFHISGLTEVFRSMASGGEIVILPRWDASAALEMIAQRKIGRVSGPPLVLSDLLDAPTAADELASVRALVVGGQALLPALVARASERLPTAGFSIGWGMTEVCGAVTAAAGSLFRARPDASGVVLPITEVCAVDPTGAPLPTGAIGELRVRGAQVMKEYFCAPDATAAVLHDGWLSTGDIGVVDADGFVRLIDRKKDIVITGGENVYCGEVERALGAHPDVIEALVFGIPDERLGERIIAAVRLREGARSTGATLRDALKRDLAAYKIPAIIAADLPEFPRNATGKVNKSALRAIYLEQAARRLEENA
jgi:acyl-CoA synthetase (AMP-forming)/AMP-acid ligase II